jgi:hypothetical protein
VAASHDIIVPSLLADVAPTRAEEAAVLGGTAPDNEAPENTEPT